MKNNKTTIELLRRCYTGVIYDVMRDAGLVGYALPTALRPILSDVTLVGPAFTYHGESSVNVDVQDTLMEWTKLLSRAPADSVMACQANDNNLAHMGELSGETLKARGIQGVIIDGGCRDVSFLQRIEFPVWCRYFTPADIVGQWLPRGLGEPITIGSTTIHTGDIVVADLDGIMIVPQEHAKDIAVAAVAAIGTEDRVRAELIKGADPHEAYLKYGKF